MLKFKSSLAAGLSIAAALFAATAHPVPGQAAPTGTELHAVDLTNVAQTLVANGPQAKAYIGRRFEAEGKYRGGPVQGQNPVEIEFADFAVMGRIRGADEVHVLCVYSRDDPALSSLLKLNLHSIPVLNVSGTVAGADRYDSEGMIVAFVKLNNCTVTKKGPAGGHLQKISSRVPS